MIIGTPVRAENVCSWFADAIKFKVRRAGSIGDYRATKELTAATAAVDWPPFDSPIHPDQKPSDAIEQAGLECAF
jgi:hypothetical protein